MSNAGLVSMSKRVYLSQNKVRITPEEDTPVRLRIPRRRATVQDLSSRLQHASQRDDVRVVRRLTVWIDLLGHQGPLAVWCERWGLSLSGLSDWQKAFLLHGLASVVDGHGGGRPPQ